jgi:ribosomal protein S6--L-glutamate ligase
VKVCFLLERGSPPRVNPIVAETMEIMRGRGVGVESVYAEEELIRLDALSVEADLYLLKSDTELSLSLAMVLETLGARVVNCVETCILCKDKVLTAATLARAGIPAPRSLAAAEPAMLVPEIARDPLILKAPRGYHGVGITAVEDASLLPSPGVYPDFVFAQKYLAQARKDLKIFGIGEKVFGVRKPFSSDSFSRAGEACELPPGVEDAARCCARAFGLELYGLDIAETEQGVLVIDVNYFPGYRGVAGAARHLAAFILSKIL